MLTHRLESIGRPLKLGLLLRVLSRGACYVEDEPAAGGRCRWRCSRAGAGRRCASRFRKRAARSDVAATSPRSAGRCAGRTKRPVVRPDRRPVYLRTDLSFGLKAGGSVGHIAGVLNHLDEFAGPPILLTTDTIPTVRADIEVHCVSPLRGVLGVSGAAELRDEPRVRRRRPSAHRRCPSSRLRLSALQPQQLRRRPARGARGVPFVLEYNGSEIWMSRHWGRPLEHEALSSGSRCSISPRPISIVVVSRAMEDELSARGVPRRRSSSIRTASSPTLFAGRRRSPSARSTASTARPSSASSGRSGRGTAPRCWREAFGRLIERGRTWRARVRLLMIGDGVAHARCQRCCDRAGVASKLRACSPAWSRRPTVRVTSRPATSWRRRTCRTPTARRFSDRRPSCSSTWRWAKAIVASDLDQIGEVLEHGEDGAVMVPPGDVDALAAGLAALVDDPALRAALGRKPRRLVRRAPHVARAYATDRRRARGERLHAPHEAAAGDFAGRCRRCRVRVRCR